MKTLSFITAVLFFATPLLAQQPENAPGSELSKLRQSYIDSLNHLLQQYVKDNNVAAAASVSQELDRVARATPDSEPNMSPCGAWRWPGGGVITIMANGIATNTAWKTKGVWHWIDESKHQVQIEWQDGFIDKLTVSPDGTQMHGSNNDDVKLIAYRFPSPEKGSLNVTPK
jgi:hypothetical protein